MTQTKLSDSNSDAEYMRYWTKYPPEDTANSQRIVVRKLENVTRVILRFGLRKQLQKTRRYREFNSSTILYKYFYYEESRHRINQGLVETATMGSGKS